MKTNILLIIVDDINYNSQGVTGSGIKDIILFSNLKMSLKPSPGRR